MPANSPSCRGSGWQKARRAIREHLDDGCGRATGERRRERPPSVRGIGREVRRALSPTRRARSPEPVFHARAVEAGHVEAGHPRPGEQAQARGQPCASHVAEREERRAARRRSSSREPPAEVVNEDPLYSV